MSSHTMVQKQRMVRRPGPDSSSTGRKSLLGISVTAAAFIAVFAAGSASIPLFATYRSQDGVTDSELSLVAVGYFVCAVCSLLVLGRLSDHLGRKPVSAAALVTAALGCAVLMGVNGFWPLFAGRALQGIAAGLASSALAAFVVDCAPDRPGWIVPAITTAGATVGLSLGVFTSGALVQYGPFPRQLPYAVPGGLLIACALALAAVPETVRRRRGAFASLRPRVKIPEKARAYLPAAAFVFISTWAVGGFFNAFGPSVAADYLGSAAPLVAAAVFASYMVPSVIGGPLSGRMPIVRAQRLGMSVFAIAVAGLAIATGIGSAALFIGCGILGGAGMGLATNGSMASLLTRANALDRAGLLSLVYAISYTGSALPALLVGQLSRVISLLAITCGYAGLAFLAWGATILGTRRSHTTI
ncbi:MFS transporter [Arthrobacter sp. C152]